MKKSLLGIVVLMVLIMSSCATAPKDALPEGAMALDGKWILIGRNVDGVFHERIGEPAIYEFSIKKGTMLYLYGKGKEVQKVKSFIRFDGNKIYHTSTIFRPSSISKYSYFGYFDINSQNVLTIYETNESTKQLISQSEFWVRYYKEMLTPEGYEEIVSSQIDNVYHRYSD